MFFQVTIVEKADSSNVLPSPLSISTKNRMTFLFANLKDRDFLVQRISDFLQQTTSKIYLERELTSSLNSSDDEVKHLFVVFPLRSQSHDSHKSFQTLFSSIKTCSSPAGLLPAGVSALQQSTAQFRLRKRANIQPERQQRPHSHTSSHDHVPPTLA